jgi:hypothetical protein
MIRLAMPLWLYLRAIEYLSAVALVLSRPCPYDVPVITECGDFLLIGGDDDA